MLERQNMSVSLVRRNYKISRVLLGERTEIENDVLYLSSDVCGRAFAQCDRNIVLDMAMSVITPAEYSTYTDTVLDVLPLAVKEEGCSPGEGATRVLSGVVLMICGRDESGEQISEAGSCEGFFSEKIRFGRPGSVDFGEIVVKVDVLIKRGERMRRPGPLACHKAAEHIATEIRTAMLSLSEERFAARCAVEEIFEHVRDASTRKKPKILIVKEIMGQGAMHEKLLLPMQPCGIAGARSDIDMGNVPVMLSPLEAIDGGIRALTCVGPSTKETSRHYFRDPLIIRALCDGELDICGVAFVGSPAFDRQKRMVAERLGRMVVAMDVDGVLVATEGYGNNHIDFANYFECIGEQGIPAVGVTFCGNFGPLITGNRYTGHLVDCVKADIGLENAILADNTMTDEDAILSLAMLKALLRGERVLPPPNRWDPEVRKKNLEVMAKGGPGLYRSEVPTATMPSPVWTPVTKPLAEMKIALVTGTGIHLKSDARFDLTTDSSFRIVPGDSSSYDLTVSHGGYDNSDVMDDTNSMFPLDRLRELAAEGLIAGVAPRHVGFMGGGGDLKKLADETGPAIAKILLSDEVDAAVFTAG